MARRASANGESLGGVSREALEREIQRRERRVRTLMGRHARLLTTLRRLEAQIRELGGPGAVTGGAPRPPGGARRGAKPGVKRPRNERNLVEALSALLKGKTMNVTKAAAEVQKAGYNTTSPNFRTIVNQTLLKSAHFKRVARGKYTAK